MKKDLPGFGRLIIHLVLIVILISILVPIVFMVATSLKSKDEYSENRFGVPRVLFFANYVDIFSRTRILFWLRNSFLVAIVSIALCLFISILASYGFSRTRFRGRLLLLNTYISLMVVSPIILVIPLFVLFVRLKLINNYLPPVLIYTGLMMLWTIFMLKTFFDEIPNSIVESAIIDGAGDWLIIFGIFVPLSKPALFTLIMVDFIFVWNELLVALIFLQKAELQTLMAGISFFKSRYNINIPMTMVGLVIATIPMVAIYLSGQKQFIENLTMGYSKGGD